MHQRILNFPLNSERRQYFVRPRRADPDMRTPQSWDYSMSTHKYNRSKKLQQQYTNYVRRHRCFMEEFHSMQDGCNSFVLEKTMHYGVWTCNYFNVENKICCGASCICSSLLPNTSRFFHFRAHIANCTQFSCVTSFLT